MVFQDLQVVYGKRREIFGIGRGGEVTKLARDEYKPYFYVFSQSKPEMPSYADVEEKDMIPLVFDPARGGYAPARDLRVFKVLVPSPSHVKRMMETIPLKYGGIVKFDVRAAFDLVDSFFIAEDPLLSGGDLAEAMARTAEEVSKYKVLSFDIEVEGQGSYFPAPGSSRILSASISVARISEVLGSNLEATIEESEVIYGDSSEEIVAGIAEAIEREVPDFIVGYNSAAFDLRFYKHYMDDWGEDDYIPIGDKMYTHLDLFRFVRSMRSALGIRSTTANSLDEVARELGILKPGTEIYEVERIANPEEILSWFKSDRRRYELYSKADSSISLHIAASWIPVLAGVSAISKIPISRLQSLPSAGSIVEYMIIRYLENLEPGVVTEYRRREWDYGKAPAFSGLEEEYVIGKVISAKPGFYSRIAVFDFDQLYPTIYTFFQVDPISSFASKEPVHAGSMKIYASKKGMGYVFYFNPAPGSVSSLLSRLYMARKRAKEMSKNSTFAKLADRALKIIANSAYGALSKEAGNIINEFASAYIFYKSNEILLRAKAAVEKMGLRVVYGDTDSIFIELPEYASGDILEAMIDDVVSSIRSSVGEAFSLKFEGLYDTMIIAMRKTGGESKKSYVLIGEDEIILKGIFYKHELPEILDVNREEVVRMLINGEDPTKIVEKFISNLSDSAALRGLTIRKTVDLDFVSEDTGKLKILNKPFHYAAIYMLCLGGFCDGSHGSRFLSYPVPTSSPVITVRYIPITPRDIIVLIGEKTHRVSINRVDAVESNERRGYAISFRAREIGVQEALRAGKAFAIRSLNDLSSILPRRAPSQRQLQTFR